MHSGDWVGRVTAALSFCLFSTLVQAADWNGYASLGTDYIFRGVSLLDSGPSLQASVGGRFDDTIIAGAWAAKYRRWPSISAACPITSS